MIPTAFAGAPVEVLVSGVTAREADSIDMISFYTPIVFAFVLGLSFFLLMVLFRSIVVPLKAILMNLLSVGAAYGALVLVFQKGVGHALFGFQKTATIEAWVPIFLFCILFGLSMDYHVFLLSRIREHFDKTRRNRESVAVGLRSTGRIITNNGTRAAKINQQIIHTRILEGHRKVYLGQGGLVGCIDPADLVQLEGDSAGLCRREYHDTRVDVGQIQSTGCEL